METYVCVFLRHCGLDGSPASCANLYELPAIGELPLPKDRRGGRRALRERSRLFVNLRKRLAVNQERKERERERQRERQREQASGIILVGEPGGVLHD